MTSGYVSGKPVDKLPSRPKKIPGAPDIVEGEFLRCIVGSTLFGMNTDISDIDLMGICIEDPTKVIGLEPFEQIVYPQKAHGQRTKPGEVDCTVYGLRKFMSMALGQNPTILTMFFVPPEYRVYDGILADNFRSMTDKVVSRTCSRTFTGYLRRRIEKMKTDKSKRPELIKKYGYDVKFGAHAVRLGFQGIDILKNGYLTLPMAKGDRETVTRVRNGKLTQLEVIALCQELEWAIKDWEKVSPLREEPDVDAVMRFLVDTYQSQWRNGY